MSDRLSVYMERDRFADELAATPGVDVTVVPNRGRDYSRLRAEEIAGADVYASYLAEITDETLAGADDLQLIVRLGAGFDNVDLGACAERGVPVVHVPQGPTEGVAQVTLGLIIACANNVRAYDRRFRERGWEANVLFTGRRLTRSTVGVIGMGLIGSRVIELLDPFGAEVVVYDPYADEGDAADLGVELVGLDELLETADFVTVHVPRTEETLGMLGEASFRRMKESAYLINTSRGGIYPDADLARAVREGWIAGAAIDVFEDEIDASNNPLLALDDEESLHCLFTPHSVSRTQYTNEIVLDYLVEIVECLQAGEFPPNILTPAAYDEPVPAERLSPSFLPPE